MFVTLSRLCAIWLETIWEGVGEVEISDRWIREMKKTHAKKHAAIWMTKCLLCVQVPDTECIFHT